MEIFGFPLSVHSPDVSGLFSDWTTRLYTPPTFTSFSFDSLYSSELLTTVKSYLLTAGSV